MVGPTCQPLISLFPLSLSPELSSPASLAAGGSSRFLSSPRHHARRRSSSSPHRARSATRAAEDLFLSSSFLAKTEQLPLAGKIRGPHSTSGRFLSSTAP